MVEEVELTQSAFVDLDYVGFGVAYIRNRTTVPVVGLATVDFVTGNEGTVEVRPGEAFQFAGQVWQFEEIRDPADPDWAVVLRRVDGP